MRGVNHFYPGIQLAFWNFTEERLRQRHFPVIFLKLLTSQTLPVGQLWSGACYATKFTVRHYLTNIDNYVLLNAIIYDAHLCQETLIALVIYEK